jgi:hypothetical protein
LAFLVKAFTSKSIHHDTFRFHVAWKKDLNRNPGRSSTIHLAFWRSSADSKAPEIRQFKSSNRTKYNQNSIETMKMETRIRNRIFRNALLSIFIYTLPIVLMFLTFYITGERPWEKKAKEKPETRKVEKADNNTTAND